MTRPLASKVALITGATRAIGIGAAIARALARDGARVLLHVFRPYDAAQPWGVAADEPERIAAELAEHAEVEWVELDLSDPAAPRALVESAVARFGRLDILVNNACCSEPGAGLTPCRSSWRVCSPTGFSCRDDAGGEAPRRWRKRQVPSRTTEPAPQPAGSSRGAVLMISYS